MTSRPQIVLQATGGPVGVFTGTAIWAELEPFVARFEARILNHRLVLTRLTIEFAPADPTGPGVDSAWEQGIRSVHYKAIKTGELLRALHAELQQRSELFLFEADTPEGALERALFQRLTRDDAGFVERRSEEALRAQLAATAGVPPRVGRPALPDWKLREIAEERLRFQSLGQTGFYRHLSTRYSIAESTAKSWVNKATKAGWLAQADEGDPMKPREPGPRLLDAWAGENTALEDDDG